MKKKTINCLFCGRFMEAKKKLKNFHIYPPNKKKKNKDERFCHLCGAKEIKGGWCTNSSCAEYRRYK